MFLQKPCLLPRNSSSCQGNGRNLLPPKGRSKGFISKTQVRTMDGSGKSFVVRTGHYLTIFLSNQKQILDSQPVNTFALRFSNHINIAYSTGLGHNTSICCLQMIISLSSPLSAVQFANVYSSKNQNGMA